MIKIVDNQYRNNLGEGRDYQLGFAFLQKSKTKPVVYETVQPISPCKDYLNDVVWAEHTGKFVSAYGLSYNKKGIFGRKYGYMAMRICPHLNGTQYADYHKDTQNIVNRYPVMQLFINKIEESLGIVSRTTIMPSESTIPHIFFLQLPYQWCKYTYSISLFSLLIRVSQWWKDEPDPLEYLKNFSEFPPDVYLIKEIFPKLIKLIEEKKLPKQDLTKFNGGTDVHNFGIKAFTI